MNPIIAIDFNGALLKSRPFDKAHKKWFAVMAFLLKDKSIKEYANLTDYFGKVHEVMARLLGDVEKEARTSFARHLFSMLTIAEVQQKDLIEDFVVFLKKIKPQYSLALITSAPDSSVEPILHKIGCKDLFDIVYKSPAGKHPNKKELFIEFIQKFGKPVFYIGNGDKDIESCKEIGIPSISVSWVSKGEIKGDFDIKNVKQLGKVIGWN